MTRNPCKTLYFREKWELNNDDVELVEKIGRGNFGDVYKAKLKQSHISVAVKTCKVTQKSVLPSPAEFRTGREEDNNSQDWIKRHKENTYNYKPNLVLCADADIEVWAKVITE